MTIYPGNPSLSTAVKERVGSTFQQAVALYKQGRTEEVLAGCTLILQMDPQFDPARKLIEKVRNPASPIDIDSLAPLGSANEALEEARRAMATRDFQRVINLTTEILTDDLMNDDARILGDEAREKMEAAPFVEQFAKKCDVSLAAGNLAGARNDLEKARALDPAHPAVKRIEQAILARGTGQPPAPQPSYGFDSPRPSFVVDNPAGPARSSAQASDFGFTFEEEKAAEKPPEPAPFAGFSFDSPAAPANADPFANAFNAQKPAPAPAPTPKAEAPFAGFSFDTPSAPPKPVPPQPPPASGGFTFDAPSAPSSGGGFSFDAPASGGFGFDAPSTSSTPFTSSGSGAEFDFSTASIETSPDDQRKIDQYLADGDRAFQAADYQQAIDLWSRIFLIDVTNEQASERIERAKIRRREIEQKADSIIGVAVQAFERKDFNTARARFEEVLFIDPQNTAAIDYLDRIHESTAPAAAAPTIEAPYIAPEAESFDIFADEPRSLSETPLIPPDPGMIPSPQTGKGKTGKVKAVPSPGSATAKRSLPIGLLVTILVLVLLGAGGWFAYQKFAAKPDYDPAATQALFAQAGSLAGRGKYDQAIAVLQDVKPEDPQHDKAVGMIADLQHKKGQAAELIQGKPAGQYMDEQIAAGQAAFTAHDYDGAKKFFETAMHVKPLPPEAKALYDTAAQQVAKLDSAKNLFRERKFADALANLGPMLQTDPQNKNIQRMILDAHFNLGATALQEDRLPDAIREFDEVLRVDANDDLAKRSKELANRYTGQPKDLLYRIYVKYLPLRQVS
jgi:tetratricopeptide (TPR) repeat protein